MQLGEAVKIFLVSILSYIRNRTRKNAVLRQQPKGVVAWLSISHHYLAHLPSHII